MQEQLRTAFPMQEQLRTAFPMQDVSVPKRGNLKVSEIVCTEVFHQGAVRYDDDVLFTEPIGVVKHFSIVFEHQPLVGICSWKGLVEAASVFANGDAEGSKPFLASAVKDLERGMGGDHTDGNGVLVVAFKPASHGIERYAHMEGFRNRSMSIMLVNDVELMSDEGCWMRMKGLTTLTVLFS